MNLSNSSSGLENFSQYFFMLCIQSSRRKWEGNRILHVHNRVNRLVSLLCHHDCNVSFTLLSFSCFLYYEAVILQRNQCLGFLVLHVLLCILFSCRSFRYFCGFFFILLLRFVVMAIKLDEEGEKRRVPSLFLRLLLIMIRRLGSHTTFMQFSQSISFLHFSRWYKISC